jgi:hypothetical protein
MNGIEKLQNSETQGTISIPLRRMTQAELDAFLEKAADILRGNVDHSEFRGYVFALLFFKRISDVFEEAVRNLAKKLGDELANDPAMQKSPYRSSYLLIRCGKRSPLGRRRRKSPHCNSGNRSMTPCLRSSGTKTPSCILAFPPATINAHRDPMLRNMV